MGARLPGVILVAAARADLWTLYWQRTYFWAAIGFRVSDASEIDYFGEAY